jgi:hypothetical protein
MILLGLYTPLGPLGDSEVTIYSHAIPQYFKYRNIPFPRVVYYIYLVLYISPPKKVPKVRI